MPFKKGQSGNPGGRPKELMWRNALQMAITSKTGKPLAEALAEIAGGLVDAARAGDLSAIKEIADRIDGKPTSQVDMNHGVVDYDGNSISMAETTKLLIEALGGKADDHVK